MNYRHRTDPTREYLALIYYIPLRLERGDGTKVYIAILALNI